MIGAHEKHGGTLPSRVSCDELLAFSELCDVIHMSMSGVDFTWTNGRNNERQTYIRLDKHCEMRLRILVGLKLPVEH